MDLKEKRISEGLNQWDLVLLTGISQSRISLMENGYIYPRNDERQKLADAFGERIEKLFPEEAVNAGEKI